MFKRQFYHNESTSEDCAFWRQELADLKSNLRIVKERLAQFVMSTDPANLQLVRRKRELETQIADLEERLATRCDERMGGEENMKAAAQRAVLAELRRVLGDRFDAGELRDLCFDLGVDYDELSGKVKADKVRALLGYLERRARIPELVQVVKQLRPDISGEDEEGTLKRSDSSSPPLPQLAEALQRGSLAFFVGADLPREITGMPSRADLARDLARRNELDESLSLAEAAQRVSRGGNQREFTAFIREALDVTGKSPQTFHRRIVELIKIHQIKTLVATAYDNLLELAFQEVGVGINRVARSSDLSFIDPSRPTLIKLYGDAQQPETLVVTEDDHYGLWRDRDKQDLLEQIRSALRKNTTLFLGYNLSDPDFNSLWRGVVDRAGDFLPDAYAVWPGLAEAEVQMWRDRGIVILDADPFEILDVSRTTSAPFAITRDSQPIAPDDIPQINTHIRLEKWEKGILQHIHRGCDRVIVESEFGGGYSGTRVLLTLPLTADGARMAHKVSKLGLALGLRRERNIYKQFVEDFLPFCAAQVREYVEQGERAGLNYVFVGGGALGQALDLETYYRRHPVEQVVRTLDGLLDRELGQRWYRQATPLNCLFSAEYGRHMVEHLRLRLRLASSDVLRPGERPGDTVSGYRRIDVNDIPHQYESVCPGTLLEIEGLEVVKVKRDLIKLQDPGGQGIVVRVALDPASKVALGLEVGGVVNVRGEVVYNRREQMAQVARAAFPALSSELDSECIGLPSCEGTYPNPLRVYLDVLGRTLEGRKSYVHGDLHMRNVLVDEEGKGWLIDFARVEERHNLFDFVKLEVYVRLMELAEIDPSLSLDEYVQFEQALADDTLGKGEAGQMCPANCDLEFAYQVIRAIRAIARRYMGSNPDFRNEYFVALFLYCLAMTKYFQPNKPQPTRLIFSTACVLGRYVLGQDGGPRPSL
ncbi:MAG: phosphotransferase [bacterium]|nr:phosphotransferase [bacterium]